MDKPEDAWSPFDLAMGAAEKLSPPPDFDGPVRQRRLTDRFCLLILLATWGVVTWIGVWSLQNGNYKTLLYPMDYKGRMCGLDNDSNGQRLPPYWHPVDALSNGVCIEECPVNSNFSPSSKSELICKDEADLLQMDGCSSGGVITNDLSLLIVCGGCMYQTESNALNNYCQPTSVGSIMNEVNKNALANGKEELSYWTGYEYSSYLQRFVRDLRTSISIVAGAGLGGATLLGILFVILFRCSISIPAVIWSCATLVPLAFGGAGTFLFFLSSDRELDQTGRYSSFDIHFIKILAYIAWVAAGVSLSSLVLMRKDIRKTTSIAKAASRAIREITHVPIIAVMEVVGLVILIGVIGFWTLMIAASPRIVENVSPLFGYDITYLTQEYSLLAHYMFWCILIVAIWTCEFITALGKITLSHSFAGWYFTPDKEDGHEVRVTKSTGVAILFHAGTSASGSFLIKPIILMRSPFLLLQSFIKRSGLDNCCMDGLICCCQCGLFVLERFLKFTSKHAYQHAAIFGTSFWKSSHESYYLRRRHDDFIQELGPVSMFSVMYTKLFITVGISLGSYVLLDIFYGEKLNSIIAVTAVIAVLAWYTGEIFTDVLGEAVSTLVYCYMADEEIMGSEGAQYVTPELDDFLDQIYAGIASHNNLAIAGNDIVIEKNMDISPPASPKNTDLV